MREKLIKILDDFDVYDDWLSNIDIADHLIANGVTIPVRCKDCEFSKYYTESGVRKCRTYNGVYRTVSDDEYCSYGERRSDAETD